MPLKKYPRKVNLAMSQQQVNDAFTSLLLMTGIIHEGEIISNVVLPTSWTNNAELVKFTIQKEVTN